MSVWYAANDPAVQDAFLDFNRKFNGAVLQMKEVPGGFQVSHQGGGLSMACRPGKTEMEGLQNYWAAWFRLDAACCEDNKGWAKGIWRALSPRYRAHCRRSNERLERWLAWGQENNLIREDGSE